MTNQPESGSAPSGQQPGQAASQDGQNVQPTSPQTPFTPDQEAFIRELVKRTDQSEKDRAVHRLQQQVDEQGDQLARYFELFKQGKTLDQAKREVAIDEFLRSPDRQAPAPVAPTNVTPADATANVDFASMYAALGLDAADNDVINLTVKHSANPAKLSFELINLKNRRAANPAATPASVAQTPGGGAPSTDINHVLSEIAELSKDPMKNFKRLQELQRQLPRS